MPRTDPITYQTKLVKVKAATAAGTGDTISSDVVDTQGWAGVVFFTTFGAITATAVTTMKAQQGAASDLSDGADLEGTGISVADDDDNQSFAIDVAQPRERYLRCQVVRATANAVIGEIYALLYGPRTKPKSWTVTDTVTAETHVNPAEGTA